MTDQECRCGSELEQQLVTRFQQYEGEYFILENIPAFVCERCGAVYYTPDAHDLVLRLVQGAAQPARVQAVKVYDGALA